MHSDLIPPAVRLLIEAGHAAPSADNCQPWRFCWNGTSLSVGYDTQRLMGKTFEFGDHATLLAIGALKENILQVATSGGIAVKPYSRREAKSYFDLEILSEPEAISEGHRHPVFQRHTNRWPFKPTRITGQIVDSMNTMFQDPCRVHVITDWDMIETVSEWIRIASEVRFQTREVHEFLGRSLRFTAEEANVGDGLDVRTLALPSGGKTFLRLIKDWKRMAFLNRFRCYELLAKMEAQPILRSTCLAAILGPNDWKGVINAGMLMERVWISLNTHGLAVHPYYVIPDQLQRLEKGTIPAYLASSIQSMRKEIATTLFTNRDETIHMLFRLGYPTKNPFRSSRLSTTQVAEYCAR